jgi:hypothetical protein
MSYIITSFALMEKEQVLVSLQEFIQHSPFPTSFVKKTIELASRCNFLVRYFA